MLKPTPWEGDNEEEGDVERAERREVEEEEERREVGGEKI